MRSVIWILLLLGLVAEVLTAGLDGVYVVQVTVTTTVIESETSSKSSSKSSSSSSSDPYSASVIAGALSSIVSLNSLLQPPASLASIVAAIPTSIQAAFGGDEKALDSIVAGFATGIPQWYKDLPPAAQSYLLDVGPKALTIQPVLLSLESVAGVTITPWKAKDNLSAAVTGTGRLGNESVISKQQSTSTTTVRTLSDTSPFSAQSQTSSSSVSAAGAPRQTAAMAASFLGAIGVLGLAVGL